MDGGEGRRAEAPRDDEARSGRRQESTQKARKPGTSPSAESSAFRNLAQRPIEGRDSAHRRSSLRARALIPPLLLLLYSGALLFLEAEHGTYAARAYLEDPPEAVLFGHVNTTLSTGLLWAIALLFAVTLKVDTAAGRRAPLGRFFPVTQIALFLLLGLDERFRLVPPACRAIGAPEWAAYGSLAVAELLLLLGPGRLLTRRREAGLALAAGAAFAWSMGIDQFGWNVPWKQSLEELPKVWGGALFLAFAWSRLHESLDALAFPGVHGGVLSWARARETEPAGIHWQAPQPMRSGRPAEADKRALEPTGVPEPTAVPAAGPQRTGRPF